MPRPIRLVPIARPTGTPMTTAATSAANTRPQAGGDMLRQRRVDEAVAGDRNELAPHGERRRQEDRRHQLQARRQRPDRQTTAEW